MNFLDNRMGCQCADDDVGTMIGCNIDTETPRVITRQEATMPKLTKTQTIILSRAATRPDNLAMPLPDGLH
ncbi:hypothetical protein [Pseudogemmobacter sp. W21_MBD1_M6]|uniref:hypothetical protein n=1 Tax=Pseudogemmobacter sp. W21_MBD1_M6 TaxID=3240271 RepID=UPI003F9E1808